MLIADDDIVVRDVVRRYLERDGLEVSIAHDGSEALRLLGGNIRKACVTPQDRQVRSDMLLGSMLAGMAFANAPVAAVHALAYPLGGHFHVPHGLSNALVLPHVLAFNMPEALPLYAELGPIVFPELEGEPATARAEGLGVPTRSTMTFSPRRRRRSRHRAPATPDRIRDERPAKLPHRPLGATITFTAAVAADLGWPCRFGRSLGVRSGNRRS